MIVGGFNRFAWKYSNFSAPSTTPGTSVTPGASNTEGSWTQIATSANIANEVWALMLLIAGGNTSGAQKDHLVDIGIDPAGGTNYSMLIENIVCGQSAAYTAGGRYYYFPIRIPAGSSVAARCQGSNATAGTIRVGAVFYGLPSDPTAARLGQFTETIGTVSGSGGVSFTPGTNGAEGTWVSLGTTSRRLWWWQIGVQVSNATTTSLMYHVDLAYGDGTNMHIIIENYPLFLPGTAEIVASPLLMEGFCDVPAGATIYVRGSCSGTPATGWNALAIGVGG